MERIEKYQKIIEKEVYFWKNHQSSEMPDVQFKVIVDEAKTNFIVVSMGWRKRVYEYNLLFHIELINDKIYVHEDTTGIGIVKQFINEGVNQDDIVLSYDESQMEEKILEVI